ncbi:MAG TPA: N4-gp56 family major capsid protein [Azospirillum sp.]|nr:N4-gp56 family major capsid protein [Azospirillum sp.]
MAGTSYGVNHPLAVKLWSRKLMSEAIKATWFSKFIGTSANSIVQIKSETSKDSGDKVTFGLRARLRGAGVQGDATLEGNEEALTTYDDNVIIDQMRHAVRSKGKMSEQRVPFNVRDEAKEGLKDWFAERLDVWFFNQLAGYTAETRTLFTGNQAVVAPDAYHRIFAGTGNAADEDLADTDLFSLSLIDKAVELANTLDHETAEGLVPLRPLRMDGEDKYVMFLHDYQVTDLRTTTSTGQWLDIQKAAMAGGQVSKNPIYTGALGEYNGVILHKANRVPKGVHSSTGAAIDTVRRAVLCGAQAAAMAFGQGGSLNKMDWTEELFDYGNQLGVAAGMIAGLKKTRFNDRDFGTIVVSTYAAKHS